MKSIAYAIAFCGVVYGAIHARGEFFEFPLITVAFWLLVAVIAKDEK